MDRQTAIDRITETENLTDGLEDDDANWLLDWGIAQVDGLVTGIKDEDAAGEKLNQLMSVMRTLNQIAADRAAKAPDALAGDIRTFLERYQQAFGAPKAAAPADHNSSGGKSGRRSAAPDADEQYAIKVHARFGLREEGRGGLDNASHIIFSIFGYCSIERHVSCKRGDECDESG
jgi:hypothetical protein